MHPDKSNTQNILNIWKIPNIQKEKKMSLVRNKETIIIRGDERPENNHYNVQVVIGPLSLMVTSKSQYLVKNVERKKYLKVYILVTNWLTDMTQADRESFHFSG